MFLFYLIRNDGVGYPGGEDSPLCGGVQHLRGDHLGGDHLRVDHRSVHQHGCSCNTKGQPINDYISPSVPGKILGDFVAGG